jgi:hypothetical protein
LASVKELAKESVLALEPKVVTTDLAPVLA